jgi:hypothetical protein
MCPRASRIISPQEGVGGTTPRPRKLRPDSRRMAAATVRENCTMIGARTLGRIVLNISRTWPPPRARVASTYSIRFTLSTSPYVIRAKLGTYRTAITRVRVRMPGPNSVTTRMASTMGGKERIRSARRTVKISTRPEK